MQNFIFISPNFPTNYWQFCRELKNNGLNVLGIGDQPYEELKPELKASLNEYYKVNSLENYDEVYRAVAFFTFKYGRIDWLESNNEYWLERDAALRTDFHITSGFQTSDMPRIKYKSKMKEYYQKAGIATARYHMVDDLAAARPLWNRWATRWWLSRTTAWALRIPTAFPPTRNWKNFWPTRKKSTRMWLTSWRSSSVPR